MLQLMVALRFDSESFAKGDRKKAQTAFVEALELFTLTGDQMIPIIIRKDIE